MPDYLILRFDAPLMSFGGAMVDKHGVTADFPGLSLLTGLIGNALGYRHQDAPRLARLQERIRYSVRCDRVGSRLRDYQTVDLGQEHLLRGGWTTRGVAEERKGGKASKGTHIRLRDYHAGAIYTLTLTLVPPDEPPDLEALELALREPERPLFLGRKHCLPSVPLVQGHVRATTLLEALAEAPRAPGEQREPDGDAVRAWWPADEETEDVPFRPLPVFDCRDWENQIHSGRRIVHEGQITLQELDHDG